MKYISVLLTLLLSLGLSFSAFASGGGDRLKEVGEYNLEKGIGLKGNDPVSYFLGASEKGSLDHSMDYAGVTYLFASESNLDLFVNEAIQNKQEGIDVLKYEPTYGGWCAYAMAVAGQKVDINPALFDIYENRLHFFVNQDALNNWLADRDNLVKKADRKWKRILTKAKR